MTVKDLSEVLKPVGPYFKCVGRQVSTEELVNQVIIIEGFTFRTGEGTLTNTYATIQITSSGEKLWFNCGSVGIIQILNRIEDKLPVQCKVVKKLSKRKMRYYTLVGAK